jgi:G3E family GTPase
MSRTPVVVLTGFLGSGKTTLLSQLLKDPRFSDTAVVLNEVGEIALDHYLVETTNEAWLQQTFGCLCCTVRGDIRQTLLLLHASSMQGEIPTFSRLIIETNGLADPAPVLQTLLGDAGVTRCYRLDSVVALVDAVNGAASLDQHAECVKQVAIADRLVLTKTELAEPAALAALQARLKRLNPVAPLLDKATAFDRRLLFDIGPYTPNGKIPDVQRWLGELEQMTTTDDHPVHQDHQDHQDSADPLVHSHTIGHHDAAIQSHILIRDQPIRRLAFETALELLAEYRGADLLRVKGIVNIKERPNTPLLVHAVQHLVDEPVWLNGWPNGDRRTRLLLITRNIPAQTLDPFFAAFASTG